MRQKELVSRRSKLRVEVFRISPIPYILARAIDVARV